jgi:hypothetical protein
MSKSLMISCCGCCARRGFGGWEGPTWFFWQFHLRNLVIVTRLLYY